MASCVPPTAGPLAAKFHDFFSSSPPLFTSSASFGSRNLFTYAQTSSSVNRRIRRSFQLPDRAWSGRCRATSPSPPSPPKLDPPPGGNSDSSPGIMSRLSRVQDAVRIFFAVLFWMSLFFWSCVWDGRNGGRPNKGSRFRR